MGFWEYTLYLQDLKGRGALVLMAIIVIAVIVFMILSSIESVSNDIPVDSKDEEEYKKENDKEDTVDNKFNESLKNYYKAIEDKDLEKAQKYLMEAYKYCDNHTGYCMTELFCPECPLGGMPVTSGRSEY